jgi:hypothetical protein
MFDFSFVDLTQPEPKQIKMLRLKFGLTQTEAASIVHKNLVSWQRYEWGTREIDLATWELFQIKTHFLEPKSKPKPGRKKSEKP